jgi:mono/diheme cytochrome c family protein
LAGCDEDEPVDRTTTILGLEGDAMAGGTVFSATCATSDCHGPDGAGGPDAPAPGPPQPLDMLVPARTDEAIVNVMLDGLGNMKPLAGVLEDQQMADVLAYVNAEFGPSQG